MLRGVSVVVPFGGGLDLLRRQVACLIKQDYPGELEVIIACNSECMSLESMELPRPTGNVHIRVVDATAVRGPSFARNSGWRSATFDLVLFCDADDEVQNTWVSGMSRALQSAELVGGRLSYGRLNPMSDARWNTKLTDGLSRKFRHLEFAPSCNLGVRINVLQELDGFDESLSCGEDIDLCWRAQYLGHVIKFVSDAVVDYRLRTKPLALWRQCYQYGLSDAILLGKHSAYGAQRPIMDSMQEALAVPWAIVSSIRQPSLYKKFIVRCAAITGRIVGSAKERRWAV